jgi:hypothetical protein
LLLFLLNFGRFGRRGQGRVGEGFFSFFFGPNVFPNIILQCVLSHFHLLRPLEPHPQPLSFPLHEKNKNHDPPKPLAHASFEKKKTHPNLLTHPPNPKNTSPNTLPSPSKS